MVNGSETSTECSRYISENTSFFFSCLCIIEKNKNKSKVISISSRCNVSYSCNVHLVVFNKLAFGTGAILSVWGFICVCVFVFFGVFFPPRIRKADD